MEEVREKNEEIVLTGMLAEFKKALQDEISKIEKSGQSSTLLKNGKRIEGNGSDFWYKFLVEYLPAIPADAPCKLIIGTSQYSVTVIGCDENEVIISSSNEINGSLANARLENGSTVLMERLIKRIEDNSTKTNTAGRRIFSMDGDAAPSFDVIEPDLPIPHMDKMTANQQDAVVSALQNNITYIWGPPGTGKTSVIGEIINALYALNRSVLVVSHTNTAVDGAIQKVEKLRTAEGVCPVLRLGTPQKELSEEVLLESHIRRLGEELFARLEELKTIKNLKNERLSVIDFILQKAAWVSESQLSRIQKEIESLESYIVLRDEALLEYEKASAELKKIKVENPDIEKLSGFKSKKETLYAQVIEASEKEKEIKQSIETSKKNIETAEEELAKFRVYEGLTRQINEIMPESFLLDRINEQDAAVADLTKQKEQCEADKKEKDDIIAQGRKNSITLLLSKKAVQQAEAALPILSQKIEDFKTKIEIASKTRDDYYQKLISRKSLLQQREEVNPSKTEEYWKKLQEESISYLESSQISLIELQAVQNKLNDELAECNKQIERLQPLNAMMFKLISAASAKKKKYTEADENLNSHKVLCEDLLGEEIKRCNQLDIEVISSTIQEKYTEINVHYLAIKDEVAGEQVELLKEEINALRAELTDIHNEIKSISEKINELEKEAIMQARIVGSTLAKSYLSDVMQEIKFDTVILDEASMASIPALWCTSYLADRNIIIVGDFLQLPPIVMADTAMAKKWLGRDIFAASGMQERAKNKKTKPANFIMLNDQFRMEKEIADIANLYYGGYGGLKSDDNLPERVVNRTKFYNWFPGDRKRSVEIVDTSSLHAWVTSIPQGKGHSRLNCFSAALDVEMAFTWLADDVKTMQESGVPVKEPKVLIIAPYKPHVEKVKQLVEFEYKQRNLPENANLIACGTIHSFQGNEADIVIFDLVLDEPHWKANLFISTDEATTTMDKLFNVAVTRAKFKLFVVGNIAYCRKRAINNSLSKLLDHLIDAQHFPITDAKEAYPKLLVSRNHQFVSDDVINRRHIICREEDFYDFFLRDIRDFKTRLIIYSPFMTKQRLSILLPFFRDAITAGKRIYVVTKAFEDRGRRELNLYREMEAELKTLGVEIIHKKGMHEKLIFVDDSAVWMGSLNALSFSGETGEVMHRHCDRELTVEYEKIYDIPLIDNTIQQSEEMRCPICGAEMELSEGNNGVYWRCVNGDYKRSMDQPYPYDGVMRCFCGGEYCFAMKKQPRWVCQNDSKHYIIMRSSDLNLPKMEAKIPSKKELLEVTKYFAEINAKDGDGSRKSDAVVSSAKKVPKISSKAKPKSSSKSDKSNRSKKENRSGKKPTNNGQLSLFDFGIADDDSDGAK